jgi:hypothetical protein
VIIPEERLATSLEQMSREITRPDRLQQVLFALVNRTDMCSPRPSPGRKAGTPDC